VARMDRPAPSKRILPGAPVRRPLSPAPQSGPSLLSGGARTVVAERIWPSHPSPAAHSAASAPPADPTAARSHDDLSSFRVPWYFCGERDRLDLVRTQGQAPVATAAVTIKVYDEWHTRSKPHFYIKTTLAIVVITIMS